MDVGDLKVKISADVSDVQRAVEQAARQGLQSAQQQATKTEAALKGAANASIKLQESLSSISEYLADAGLSADEVAEAMSAIGGNASKAADKVTSAASAAKQIAEPTKVAAKAANDMQQGFSLSNSTLLRAGAALAGVGLGINVVAGVARLVHDVIADTVQSQLDWERSLKTISGLYGDVGARIAGIATAQANQPGLLGTQQEFAQYALNASALTQRFGVNPDQVNQLITTGGRVAFATGMTDQADRERLQAQILAAVQTGANLPAQYGVYTDAEAVSRRLGFSGGNALNAFTPQEVMQARAAIVNQGLSGFADRASSNQRAAVDAVTAANKAQQQASAAVQNALESGLSGAQSAGPDTGLAAGTGKLFDNPFDLFHGAAPLRPETIQGTPGGVIEGLAGIDAESRLQQASQEYVRALADSKKVEEDNQRALEQLGKTADAAGAKLLSFTGSLEDATSIAHAQVLAQAQGGVASLARSAVPTAGMTTPEINAIARNSVFQDVLQNYTATLAQGQTANPIQAYLEQQANMQGPGLEAQRTAAQRALGQVSKLTPVANAMGQLQTSGAALDLETAQKEADLERIALTQRERYVQLLRDTVELRLEDNQQQQQTVRASMDLIRAQQAALGPERVGSEATFQQNMAQALARQRMARLLQGKDVSDLPSLDQLVNQNYRGQLAEAENGPALVGAQQNVQREQFGVTSTALEQALTEGQIRLAELANDAKNLRDIPLQTQHELELIGLNRDQLTVQTELREYTKQLIWVMQNTANPPSAAGHVADQGDRYAQAFAALNAPSAPSAPSELAGARR